MLDISYISCKSFYAPVFMVKYKSPYEICDTLLCIIKQH